MNINLMSANITAAAAGSSADLTDRSEERLPPGRAPAQAVPRPVCRNLRGNPRQRAVASGCSCRTPPRSAPTSFRRPRRRRGAPSRIALSEGLGRSGPSRSGASPSVAVVGVVLTLLPQFFPSAPAPHPIACRRGSRLDLSVALRPALLHRRTARLVVRRRSIRSGLTS